MIQLAKICKKSSESFFKNESRVFDTFPSTEKISEFRNITKLHQLRRIAHFWKSTDEKNDYAVFLWINFRSMRLFKNLNTYRQYLTGAHSRWKTTWNFWFLLVFKELKNYFKV